MLEQNWLYLVALRSRIESSKRVNTLKVWKFEEPSNEDFDEDSDNEEMTFIIRIFHQLARRNKKFSNKGNTFRSSNFINKKDE